MASPGAGRSRRNQRTDNRHYRKHSWSKASKVMMDQQNFEAARPVSRRSPPLLWQKALGQLPKGRPPRRRRKQRPRPRWKTLPRSWVSSSATRTNSPSRRVQARQDLFIRFAPTARPSATAGTIRRLNSMAVAAGLCRGALFARSDLASAGRRPRRPAGRLQYRYHSDWEKVREQRKAHRLARLVAALPKNPPQRLDAPVRRRADPRIRAVGGDRADRAPPRSRPGNESYARLNGTRGAHHAF